MSAPESTRPGVAPWRTPRNLPGSRQSRALDLLVSLVCPWERIMDRVETLSLPAGIALLAFAAYSSARADNLNDYPTAARVDYVFGCMKANGETRHTLDQCSCSIDVIASILPYDRYVEASTVVSMAQVPGHLGSQFRSTEIARKAIEALRRAQAEAEVRCF